MKALPSPRRWQPSPLMWLAALALVLAAALVLWRLAWWPWALAVLVLSQLPLVFASLWPRSPWLGPNRCRLDAAAAARGEIALTIDDGPDPDLTPRVLDLLDALAVRATFFCIGSRLRAAPDLAREIVRRGHQIENHSEWHSHGFAFASVGGFARELNAAQASFVAVLGYAPRFFRAPAGMRNPLLEIALCRCGLQLVSWTRRGYDTRQRDAGKVLARLCRGLAAGDILLLHDGHAAHSFQGEPVILAVLPQLVAQARALGLRCVTLDEACQ